MDDLADLQFFAWTRPTSVDVDFAAIDRLFCFGSGFKESGGPEPFVEPYLAHSSMLVLSSWYDRLQDVSGQPSFVWVMV